VFELDDLIGRHRHPGHTYQRPTNQTKRTLVDIEEEEEEEEEGRTEQSTLSRENTIQYNDDL
jgi:hypothetical protein